MSGNKVTAKYQLVILGSLLGDAVKLDFLSTKIDELDKTSNTVERLDAHYGFYLLVNCFSMPKLLYLLRTSICYAEKDLLKHYDDIS